VYLKRRTASIASGQKNKKNRKLSGALQILISTKTLTANQASRCTEIDLFQDLGCHAFNQPVSFSDKERS
jgi:hypothetical protein